MLSRRPVAVLVALAVVSVGGCASRAEPKPKTSERVEQLPVTVSIELGGDLKGSVEDRTVNTQLVMLETTDPELQGNRIFGIELVDPVPVGKSSVAAGFAVLPYRGPGKYTIAEGSIYDGATAGGAGGAGGPGSGGVGSSVKVLWRPDVAVEDVYDYYRRVEPCRVEIEDGGSTGELKCPRLTNETRDKHFSLSLKWKFANKS